MISSFVRALISAFKAKHCRILIEAESEASKDTKEAQAHLDQNVLAGYATVALASMLDPSDGLFSDAVRPGQRLFSYFAQTWQVLALFTVGDVYVSLCKKGAYALFSAQRRSRALFWL